MLHTWNKRYSLTSCKGDIDSFDVLAGTPVMKPTVAARYRSLHDALTHSKDFEPILVEDHSPPCPKRKYDYNHDLVVPVKCVYTGSQNLLHFIRKVPPDSELTGEVLTKNLNIAQDL